MVDAKEGESQETNLLLPVKNEKRVSKIET